MIRQNGKMIFRSLVILFLTFQYCAAQCVGGPNGTAQYPSYLMSNEFQDGRPAGSITPSCVRDALATGQQGTRTAQAMRVWDFYGTLGLNLQTNNGGLYANPGTTIANFQAIGARVFRDLDWTTAGSEAVYAAMIAAGYQFEAISGVGQNPVIATDLTTLKTYSGYGPKALFGVEGPNEPSISPITYNSQTSSNSGTHPGYEPIAQYQRDLLAAIRSDPVLGPIAFPFGVSSVAGAEMPDNAGIQFLTVPYGANTVTLTTNATTASGNTTLHFASVPNTTAAATVQVGQYIYGTGIAAGATVASTTSTTVVMSTGSNGGVASSASIRFGTKIADGTALATMLNQHVYPMAQGAQAQFVDVNDTTGPSDVITQDVNSEFVHPGNTTSGNYTGYSSAAVALQNPHIMSEGGIPSGTPSASGGVVTTAIQAKNLMTGWFESVFIYKFSLFCIYALYDDSSGNFGLYTNTGTIKTAGTYFSNLNTIMGQDLGANRSTFNPGSLNYNVTNLPTSNGGNSGFTALLQASNGTFYIPIWNIAQNWNFTAGSAITITGTATVVSFPKTGTINVYDPTIGTAAQQTLTGDHVTVTMTDYPQIVSFVP